MNTYSVKEISTMLHTDPETVRRWIRTGKLKAEKPSSKKEGLVVTEAMLASFLSSAPKYAGLATASSVAAILTGGVTIAASVIAGVVVQGKVDKTALEKAKIKPEDLRSLVEDEIKSNGQQIRQKRKQIEKLENDIAEIENKIQELKNLVADIYIESNKENIK